MLHIVHALQRRFPERSRLIVVLILVASVIALSAGVALLALR